MVILEEITHKEEGFEESEPVIGIRRSMDNEAVISEKRYKPSIFDKVKHDFDEHVGTSDVFNGTLYQDREAPKVVEHSDRKIIRKPKDKEERVRIIDETGFAKYRARVKIAA